jgi:hypothetical protein
MTETSAAEAPCPPWCRSNHAASRAIHARCTGEVLWRHGSVAVELAHHGGTDRVVLSSFSDDDEPAIANLTTAEAQVIRDALNSALALTRIE